MYTPVPISRGHVNADGFHEPGFSERRSRDLSPLCAPQGLQARKGMDRVRRIADNEIQTPNLAATLVDCFKIKSAAAWVRQRYSTGTGGASLDMETFADWPGPLQEQHDLHPGRVGRYSGERQGVQGTLSLALLPSLDRACRAHGHRGWAASLLGSRSA